MANEFKKAFKGIDQAIKAGTSRALNRALTSTKTQLVKTIGQETGLKASLIKTRVLDVKATTKKLSVQLAIAVKVGVSLGEFSPQTKNVKTSKGKRTGVTVKIAGNRQLVPGGFLWVAPSGKKLVLGRKTDARRPVQTLRSNVFKESAEANKTDANRQLRDKFEAEVEAQIEYAIQTKFDSNK